MRVTTLLMLLLLLSCQKPEPDPEPAQYSVPAEVEPYVQAFREAARLRNSKVATDNLIITFGPVSGEDVCGQCLLQAGKTPRITLNNNSDCWKAAYPNERECLVFHELGHCLLDRTHRSDKFPKGQYVSLMNPDDRNVYATCRYPIGDDECDKRPRQGHYHDELFKPNTAVPVWGK